MTDRVKGFTVTLEHDVRIDDVEAIMQSIRMIRGIADVSPSVTTSDDHMNRMMVRNEMLKKLYNALES